MFRRREIEASLDIPLPRDLEVSLDTPLPQELAVGAGTALFVAGTCWSPRGDVTSLELLVDGRPHAPMAFGMPRLDPFTDTGDPRSYRSGFWGLVPVLPGADPHRLALRARIAGARGGDPIEVPLAELPEPPAEAPPALPAWPAGAGEDTVTICMATYDPDEDLLRAQLDSIRAQTHANWLCLISDDGSAPEPYAALLRLTAGDERFVVSRSARRRGFFGNFERALSMVPREARFVALADQDDRWYPEKLAALVAGIGQAPLIYSDARLITPGGAPLADTYWGERTNNHTDLLSVLVANSVTGAASLMRRELLDVALPFPPSQFAHFHDHWLALCALATGDIRYLDRPLYDYVQHGAASLGHAGANRMVSLRERLSSRRELRERVRLWRMHYFVDACRLMTLATILELRAGERISESKRRSLRAVLDADRSLWPLARLAGRGARELLGRPETLGAEWMLLHAYAWRRLLSLSAPAGPRGRLRLDAVPPERLAQRPARAPLPESIRPVAEKIAPLDLGISDAAPERLNVLIPTFDLKHFFGGYIAKLNLAARLAERGERVRLVTVDPVGSLPRDWRAQVEAYSGLDGLFDRVEVEFGRGPVPLEVSPQDRFLATTWWSGLIAAAAVRVVGGGRFGYLIQEYEPFTFPMGSWAALAQASYEPEHFALFSSELLREYFRRHRIGVFGGGDSEGGTMSASFQNAISDVRAPTVQQLAQRASRRLLFYARPEGHAARNMFELGALGLAQAIEQGVLGPEWELRGIGTVSGRESLPLSGGRSLVLVPRMNQDGYAEMLTEHDVGLSLMYTPHPSLVPIEMAAAGLTTVTNIFENKTAQALRAISPNLLAAVPSPEGIVAALAAAVARADDHAARVRGSAVDWARSWAQAFPDALLTRMLESLRTSG